MMVGMKRLTLIALAALSFAACTPAQVEEVVDIIDPPTPTTTPTPSLGGAPWPDGLPDTCRVVLIPRDGSWSFSDGVWFDTTHTVKGYARVAGDTAWATWLCMSWYRPESPLDISHEAGA